MELDEFSQRDVLTDEQRNARHDLMKRVAEIMDDDPNIDSDHAFCRAAHELLSKARE